jgi:hypothetical protein
VVLAEHLPELLLGHALVKRPIGDSHDGASQSPVSTAPLLRHWYGPSVPHNHIWCTAEALEIRGVYELSQGLKDELGLEEQVWSPDRTGNPDCCAPTDQLRTGQ